MSAIGAYLTCVESTLAVIVSPHERSHVLMHIGQNISMLHMRCVKLEYHSTTCSAMTIPLKLLSNLNEGDRCRVKKHEPRREGSNLFIISICFNGIQAVEALFWEGL